jgi:CheY-like chemotaxis protein
MAGHDVRTAYSGREALALAADFRPQVALLDIGMPGMNGYDLARQIRAAAWGRDILLVAVTGWGQDEDRRQAEAAGFDLHRVKPIDLDSLEDLLTTSGPSATTTPS